MKNEAHCLGPVSNVFWINDIKRFQTVVITCKIAWFDQQKQPLFDLQKIASFVWHTTIVADNLWYLSKWGHFWRPPNAWSGSATGWRCLSDFSVRARQLVLTVCAFPLIRRKVRAFAWKAPCVKVVVTFSPLCCGTVIVTIKGCNSLRACFLTSVEQERFFKCNIFFHELFHIRFLYRLSGY